MAAAQFVADLLEGLSALGGHFGEFAGGGLEELPWGSAQATRGHEAVEELVGAQLWDLCDEVLAEVWQEWAGGDFQKRRADENCEEVRCIDLGKLHVLEWAEIGQFLYEFGIFGLGCDSP